jgi:hypothetical protein
MSTTPAAEQTPPSLSLEKRPFNVREMAEFVHHLGADVEFVALDVIGDEYGSITRLQMIELLKLVPVPKCRICEQNHGQPHAGVEEKIVAPLAGTPATP